MRHLHRAIAVAALTSCWAEASTPQDKLDEARLYLVLYDTALTAGREMCEEFLKRRPEAPALVRYYYGLLLFEAGRTEAALAEFQKAEKAGGEVGAVASTWREACSWGTIPTEKQIEALKEKSSRRPWAASEAGRIVAERQTALDLAVEMCEEALPKSGEARARALRNLAVVLTARGDHARAMDVLGQIDRTHPEVEVDLGIIKLKNRELPVVLPLFDPVTLRCRARCILLSEASMKSSESPEEQLQAAIALDILGRPEEAIPILERLAARPDAPPWGRQAAAQLAKIKAAGGDIQALRERFDTGTADGFLIESLGGLPLNRLSPIFPEVIERCRQVARDEREKQDLSERRFRKANKGMLWAMGRLHFLRAEALAAEGRTGDARDAYRAAWVVGNELFDAADRGSLRASGPLFVAQLGRLWLSMARWINKEYYHDICRYLYPPTGMLIDAYPDCAQIREMLQRLYASRIFDEKMDEPTEAADLPEFAAVVYGSSRPTTVSAGDVQTTHGSWKKGLVMAAVVGGCGVVVVLGRMRRLRR